MAIRERMSGNEAVAVAMKQVNPDVMGAFPITPSTEIPQYFSGYIANGEIDTEFVAVESEHSAMSCCMGAAAAGARIGAARRAVKGTGSNRSSASVFGGTGGHPGNRRYPPFGTAVFGGR